MSEPLVLGVDGGGTSTVAWLADAEGAVLGRGAAGPSNPKAVGDEAARAALQRAIQSAFGDAGKAIAPVAVACLGLAGFDRPDDRQRLHEWSAEANWAHRLVLVNDGRLVIAAGTPEGWGIAIIAGTGSIAVGRAPDGRTARAGGWGPLIGDEGSAYSVALAALRLVARRADGREPLPPAGDPLADRLCRALGIVGPAGLVAAIYAPQCDRTRIAALAPAVVAAAEEDPSLEVALLAPAGIALAETVLAVARTLGWHGGTLPLALAGGFLLATPAVARALLARLDHEGYTATAVPVADPVRGALILAKQALDLGDGQARDVRSAASH